MMKSNQQARDASVQPHRRPRVLVVGLGNDLLMDDGVGVHAARSLKQKKLGAGVTVVEVGTAILDALHLFERADHILAIDAMQAGGGPGAIYRLDGDDVVRRDLASMHDFTFQSALTLLKRQPKSVVVIGVEPGRIDYGLDLTNAVANAIPAVVQAATQIVLRWQPERGDTLARTRA